MEKKEYQVEILDFCEKCIYVVILLISPTC